MSAHLRAIRIPKCQHCNDQATEELRDSRNEVINWYCDSHASEGLDSFVRIAEKADRRGHA